ncbi:type IV secretory pathway TrbL component, partial [Hymenobacter sp. UYAg731]
GTATAGDRGTATAGDSGTATAGDSGTATAGDRGTATAGDSGTATAGDSGTATAGEEGAILIKRWNGKRYRFALGNIGEDTDAASQHLKPNTPYCLNEQGQFIPAIQPLQQPL